MRAYLFGGMLLALSGISATTAAQRKTADTTYPVFRNLSEMKSARAAGLDTGRVYLRNASGMFVQYKWNPAASGKDDSVTLISASAPSGRFELYFEHYIDVRWFGAVPDDGKDDSWAIQKAIDFAINSTGNPVVQLPGGTFIVNNVVIGRKDGSDYGFVTLTLRGNTNTVAQTTQFTCSNKNAFCLNIQRGRSVTIENIRFNGSGPSITGLRKMVETSDAAYTAGVIANQYSQHNAINIDAFHSDVPRNLRYPNVDDAWYANTSHGGTSMVTIKNCSFLNFVNGVMESPSGVVQNGDNVVVSDCYFEANKNCFSAGQTQSRANKLIGCYLLFNQTIVNGQDYGTTRGTVADIINCNIAGGTKYLYQVNGGFSGVNITNTFAEALYSFGISEDMPVTITNSQLTMCRDDVDEMFIAPVVAQGRQVTFVGGAIEYFDNLSVTPFVFNVSQLLFNGTKIRGGIPLNGYYTMGMVKFNSVNLTSNDGMGTLDETAQIPYEDVGRIVNSPIIPGMNYKLRQGFTAAAVNDKIETVYLESITIRVNSKTHTAYFITPKPGRYRQNDALADLGPSVSNPGPYDRFAGTQGSLGVITHVSGDTVKLRYVPYGINDNTKHDVYLVRIPKFLPRILGDIQNGSNVVKNVQVYGNALVNGSRVKGTGIPDGAYITKIAGNTITLSLPASATLSNNPIYDARIIFTSTNSSPVFPLASLPIIYPGDYVDAGGALDSVAGWYCIKAGVYGGTPTPVWKSVRFNDGTSGTYTPVITPGANVERATATVCQYMKVGNIITVSGELQVDTKGAGAFEAAISLPVASDLNASSDAAGTAASSNGVILRLSGDAANNRVRVNGVAANGENTVYSFTLTYKLL